MLQPAHQDRVFRSASWICSCPCSCYLSLLYKRCKGLRNPRTTTTNTSTQPAVGLKDDTTLRCPTGYWCRHGFPRSRDKNRADHLSSCLCLRDVHYAHPNVGASLSYHGHRRSSHIAGTHAAYVVLEPLRSHGLQRKQQSVCPRAGNGEAASVVRGPSRPRLSRSASLVGLSKNNRCCRCQTRALQKTTSNNKNNVHVPVLLIVREYRNFYAGNYEPAIFCVRRELGPHRTYSLK